MAEVILCRVPDVVFVVLLDVAIVIVSLRFNLLLFPGKRAGRGKSTGSLTTPQGPLSFFLGS